MGERISLDMNRVVRLVSGQTDLATAFWPHDASQQSPGSHGWIEPGGGLETAYGYFSLAGLQIWSVKSGIALPEERRFASIVAGSKRLMILPDTANAKMILKILSYTGKMLDNR